MDLTLSGADQVRFTACLETLLSPLSYPDVDGWRRAVNRRMKELFDLDCALFALIPAGNGELIFSEDRPRDVLSAYEGFFEADSGNRRADAFGLSVVNLQNLVAGDWEAWRKDPYVNDYWGPNAMADHVCIRLVEPEHGIAQFELHEERVDPDRCGDQALALMRLLLPAFKAGVGAVFRLSEYRKALSRVLDALGEPLMVCDERGQALHQNEALLTILDRHPYGSRIRDEMRQVARHLSALRYARARRHPSDGPGSVVREVRTPLGTYTACGTYASDEMLGPDACCIVVLHPPPSPPGFALPTVDVTRCSGLTRQQTRVALLLAARRSNDEVARELGISPHTARRHTEQVLQKLGVDSRREVEGALKRANPQDDHGSGRTPP